MRFEDAALLGAIAEFRLHELPILQLGMGLPLPPCRRTIATRSTGCSWLKRKLENLTLVTTDRTLPRYGVAVLEGLR